MIKPWGIHFLMLLGLLPSWNFPETHANGTPNPKLTAPGSVRRGAGRVFATTAAALQPRGTGGASK